MNLVARALKSLPDTPELMRIKDLNRRAHLGAQRLTKLIDMLLDLTRFRVGKFEINREQSNLESIVLEALSPVNPSVRFHSDGPILGMFDTVRLAQVVMNLTTNALKYGGNKDIEIELKSTQNRAILKVKDQGPGIAPSEHEKIFEVFERKSANKNISGLGLGLYITRQIVEAHGGKITVRSQVGEGAEFIVELPIVNS